MSAEKNEESVSPASVPVSKKKGRWLDWLSLFRHGVINGPNGMRSPVK